MSRSPRALLLPASLVGLPLLILFLLAGLVRTSEAGEFESAALLDRATLVPDWGGVRSGLEDAGVSLEASYTFDFLANVRGGLARKNEFVGNLDVTLTLFTEEMFDRDFGIFFAYGLWNHGGQPSSSVGDSQGVDNVAAPDAVKLFEAWWQKALFGDRASILFGLYDVNSEFYAIDSAELFLNGSFGMGAAFGTSGRNGPSTFPTASLGARFKVEPVRGFDFQLAVVDGVPGDPDHPKRMTTDLDRGDGALVIAEIGFHQSTEADPLMEEQDASRTANRRRVGRAWATRPKFARVSLGSWMYTAKQPHLSRLNGLGNPSNSLGHPGLYLAADYEADHLDLLGSRGLSLFLQLGWADGDVGQFEGYSGGGLTFLGLLPFRLQDETGLAVAAAYNGEAFRDATRAGGGEPAVAEIAIEWTHRVNLAPWISIQGDLQYIVNPGGRRDQADALVAGLRWVINL